LDEAFADKDNAAPLTLTLAKANHARAGAEIRLLWDDQAHLYVAAAPSAGGGAGSVRDLEERAGIITAMRVCAEAGIAVPAATTGRRTAYHVLAAQDAFPTALKAENNVSRRRFWALLEQMRAIGEVREERIRRSDRHYIMTLVCATEEVRACGL
jgi:hypothetical protein